MLNPLWLISMLCVISARIISCRVILQFMHAVHVFVFNFEWSIQTVNSYSLIE